MTKSLQGHLLAAPPHEFDPDFVKTVILLIQHSQQQAVGVVLNRPTETTVKEYWKSVLKKPCDFDGPMHCGGPVPGPLMAIHCCEANSEIEVLSGVYYSVTKKNLDKLVRQPDLRLKVFDSHAGWGPGQLDQQLDAGAWLSAPATAEHVFSDGEQLWEEVVGQA